MEEIKLVLRSEDGTIDQLNELANRLQETAQQIMDVGYFRTDSGTYIHISVTVE